MTATTAATVPQDTAALLERLAALEARVAALESTRPRDDVETYGRTGEAAEACRAGTCGYSEYLGSNPGGQPDLSHRGYHAQEDGYARHSEGCRRYERGLECSVCAGYERRLRA